jgi:galactokinase
VLARAPGRVNLVGEHVDYNDGFVLPVAIDRSAWVAAAPSAAGLMTIHAADLERTVRMTLESVASKLDAGGAPLEDWARYPAGVAWALADQGLPPAGIDAVLASDVPVGAGLSSSAAVEVAFAVTWRALGGWTLAPTALARLCQRAENEYVGVKSGLMDQFASVHGLRDHALWLDCRTLDFEPVALPAGVRVVVADTRVRRELATSEFNLRRRECEEAVETLRRVLPGIRALRDVSPAELSAHAGLLREVVGRRARHVVEEIARVRAVLPAVRAGDAAALGRAMVAAHESGRDLYEVSCPELDVMVEEATKIPGCHGARLTGAGFGGCTVSLVDGDVAEEFSTRLAGAYAARTGIAPEVWICRAGAGAEVIPPPSGGGRPA